MSINNSTKRGTMVGRQGVTIAVCAALFVVLLIVYLAVIAPLLNEQSEQSEPPELLPGEVLASNGKSILMFKYAPEAMIDSIEVHNSHGEYTVYRNKKGEFQIKGKEGAPFSPDGLTALAVSAGYTISIVRLEDTEEDLSVYGFGKEDTAWYLLTLVDGKTHKVYIGDKIPTGGGYYCMYDGRDAVYVIEKSIENTLLADANKLVVPALGYYVPSSDYENVQNFEIFRGQELFIKIDKSTGADGLPVYSMTYPGKYSLNLSKYTEILELLTAFNGESVELCGEEDKELDKAILKEKYGIDTDAPEYMLHYKCDDIDTYVTFSKPDEDGYMYAYTTVYNLVAKINKSQIPYLWYDIKTFIDPPVFNENIDNVAKISIKGKIDNGLEQLDVSASFTLAGKGSDILIKKDGAASAYGADDVRNFRELYKVILTIKMQDISDSVDVSSMTLLAELDIELDNGEKTSYKFYSYSSRRCFYTVNGEGEFYVLRNSVEKMLRDTDKFINGLPINDDINN